MIELAGIGVRAGEFALAGVSMTVPAGNYAVLTGPTGTGKTTLLELIAGLRRPTAGRVLLAGRDVTGLRPGERGVGYVPQDGVLFPTMTVSEHLSFALRLRKWDRTRIDERVTQLANQLGVQALLHRLPAGLSGGERQRVALGRALSFDPEILLLDEPLSGLDDDTRSEMVELLREIHARRTTTILHVTHHAAEAARLGEIRFEIRAGAVRKL